MGNNGRVHDDREAYPQASGEAPEPKADPPLLYHCDECGLQVPATQVRWSKDRRALCPRCEWPMDKVD